MPVLETHEIFRIIVLATLAFCLAMLFTPAVTHVLYKYRLGKSIRAAEETPIYSKLHAKKAGTPTMGGVLIWGTTLLLALAIFVLHKWGGVAVFDRLNFLTRSETLLPLGALVASALVGLIDDFYNVKKMGAHGGGLRVRHRLLIYALIAVVGAWWFVAKLDWTTFHVPFIGSIDVGAWYIPIFIAVIVATAFSVNEIDGLDGLSGGTLLAAFGAYGTIAFLQGRFDLAAFCGVIMGALSAFLWFNIPPARFFMGDTGAMSLGVTLGIVAMLTNTALLLIVIGFLFVVESASVIIQVLSKKLRHKKVFLSAPIHHHFEAIGWPESKIVMRFWVVAAVTAVFGIMLYLVDRT